MEEIKVGQIWQHYKGGQYKIIALAKYEDNLVDCVVYEAQHENPTYKNWIRTKENFLEKINYDGKEIQRFALIKNPD